MSSPRLTYRGAYNLVRIKPGDEWKTTFRTHYKHFEVQGNAFWAHQCSNYFSTYDERYIREYLDHFVFIYLDGIVVFSSIIKEHTHHVRLILFKLREQASHQAEKWGGWQLT